MRDWSARITEPHSIRVVVISEKSLLEHLMVVAVSFFIPNFFPIYLK